MVHSSPIKSLQPLPFPQPIQTDRSIQTQKEEKENSTTLTSTAMYDPTDPSTAPLPMSTVDVPKNYSAGGRIMLCAIIILFAVVLTVLCLHIYARWYLRRRAERRRRERRLQLLTSEHCRAANKGLDPAVLKSIPVFTFTGETPPAECAVCLCEFEEEEEGRTLPGCKHSFHLDCIDMWFFSHNTCPLCRSSVEDASKDSVCIEIKRPESSDLCDLCLNDNVTLTTASSSLSSSSWISTSTPVSPRVTRGVRAEETSDLKSPAGRIPLLKSIINRDLRLRRVASAGDLERGRRETEERVPMTPRMQQAEP